MGKLFGTDGIRGLAFREPVTEETGFNLGRAMVRFCLDRQEKPSIALGRDTRGSGERLENAIVSGIVNGGGTALRLGVVPTPAVAFLTRELGAGAGIVVSASHNPSEYNGFKVFSHEGFKLSEDEEARIEEWILSGLPSRSAAEKGRETVISDATERYAAFVTRTLPDTRAPAGLKVVADCANGATFRAAPLVFETLGIKAEVLFADPDGENINLDCGSEHTAALRRKVVETGAAAGVAFDGDGDRLIAVDEKGTVLTGDQILTICAKMLKERGALRNHRVVSTVMSNIGFRFALRSLGIDHIETNVGDRHVVEAMRSRDACLGGEDSGHIVFLDHHTTGDGIISALQLLWAVTLSGRRLSEMAGLMTPFPQVLINVPVKTKPDINRVPELAAVISRVTERLGEKGRVLVRYSGTEPVCRVMVEGEERPLVESSAREVSETVRKAIG